MMSFSSNGSWEIASYVQGARCEYPRSHLYDTHYISCRRSMHGNIELTALFAQPPSSQLSYRRCLHSDAPVSFKHIQSRYCNPDLAVSSAYLLRQTWSSVE